MYDAPSEPLIIERFRVKGLTFIQLNTRSPLAYLDDPRTLTINTKVAVVGITEMWLDESATDSKVEITDYVILRHHRNRGGVRVYIRSDILSSR